MREYRNYSATRTRHPAFSFLLIAGFFQTMGGLMGWVTAQGVDGWYQTLRQSPMNPPDFVFGVVWTALYFLLSIAFWLIWRHKSSQGRTALIALFSSHMAINWAWSPLFFIAHATGASVLVILILIFSGAMIAWLAWQFDKRVSLIFVPYLLWLIFAGHLAHYIWQSNG